MPARAGIEARIASEGSWKPFPGWRFGLESACCREAVRWRVGGAAKQRDELIGPKSYSGQPLATFVSLPLSPPLPGERNRLSRRTDWWAQTILKCPRLEQPRTICSGVR